MRRNERKVVNKQLEHEFNKTNRANNITTTNMSGNHQPIGCYGMMKTFER